MDEESGIYLFLFLTYIHELPTKNIHERNFGPSKYTREKISVSTAVKNLGFTKCPNYPRKKCWAHKISIRKNFGPTKYPREKVLDPRNTHKKEFWTKKYPREKVLDPWNTHEKKFRTPQGTMARDPWSLARSLVFNFAL